MSKKVMITGGTGYIGSWVVKYLLEDGFTVNVTVRDKSKTEKIQHLKDLAEGQPGTLAFFEADLLKEGSYSEAMDGCETVFHIASPFIYGKLKDAQKQLVDPALKGTQNVLNTVNQTATVKNVVLTSSVASVYGDAIDMKIKGLTEFSENDWNTTSTIKHQPYSYSKVLAEKEAWNINKAQNRWKLVVINPSFVMGPALSKISDSGSLAFLKDFLSGKMRSGVPAIDFGYVDIRNVAKAHILAASLPNAEGRNIIMNKVMSMLEFSKVIDSQFPGKYKLPKMESPKFMLYLVGWMFGLSFQFITKNVGYPLNMNNSKSKEILGIEYLPFEKTMKDMIEQLEG